MYITYSALSCKLAATFSTFSVFILQVKMVNHCEGLAVFQDIEHQLQESILHCFLPHSFFMKSSLN